MDDGKVMKRNSTLWLTILAAIALVVLGILLSQFVRTEAASQPYTADVSLTSAVPPPRTMADLIRHADIVVEGTIGNIVKEDYFSGYDAQGSLIPSQPPNPTNASLAYTDYEITPENTLRGKEAVQSNKPTILRLIGHPQFTSDGRASRQGHFPMSYPGDKHLFFLSKNPDDSYGLFYGPWSRLNVDGATVTISDDQQTPVTFDGQAFQPTEFLAQVNQAVQQMPVEPNAPAQNPAEQRQIPENAPFPREVPTPEQP